MESRQQRSQFWNIAARRMCGGFEEQRWVIDNIIRANASIGISRARSILAAPAGSKPTRISRAFANASRKWRISDRHSRRWRGAARPRREPPRRRKQLQTAARELFMAAVHWGAAQWPYDENDETNIAYNQKKRECFQKYAALADHHVEPVWIPFRDKALPACFHLPPNYRGGRIPVVISIPAWTVSRDRRRAVWRPLAQSRIGSARHRRSGAI